MRSSPILALGLAAFFAAANGWAQQPADSQQVNSSQPNPEIAAQSPASAPTITIPAGTRISLKLVSQITTKSRPGDAVRAVTSFPVAAGTQTAIPVGTYVEGVIKKLNKRMPNVEMQFTRLLYANGYTVNMTGENLQAKNTDAAAPAVRQPDATYASGFASPSAFPSPSPFLDDAAPEPAYTPAGYTPVPEQFPTPTPAPPTLPPPPHSHIGLAIGLTVGSGVAIIATALLFHHRGGNGVLFDAGWQFEMDLQEPLSVDAANVAAALALPPAQ